MSKGSYIRIFKTKKEKKKKEVNIHGISVQWF